jgi:hypothetical protein
MSKRHVFKLAVMVAALSAMTLLQGCGEEEDRVVFRFVWAPVGFGSFFGFGSTGGQVSPGEASQTSAGAAGGVTAAGAARAGGGGNQVGGAGF